MCVQRYVSVYVGMWMSVSVSDGNGGFVPFIPDWAYVTSAVAGIVGSILVVVRRFQRLTV